MQPPLAMWLNIKVVATYPITSHTRLTTYTREFPGILHQNIPEKRSTTDIQWDRESISCEICGSRGVKWDEWQQRSLMDLTIERFLNL